MDQLTSATRVARRLTFNSTFFSDYWAALCARIRRDNFADLVYSRILEHPLLQFQADNAELFQHYGIITLSREQLDTDPLGYYQQFVTRITGLHLDPQDDHAFDMAPLATAYTTYRQAQRYIYTCVIETLAVGTSMHYARSIPFGAGTRLMALIYNDNNRQTTMSLLAIFKAMMNLLLTPPETLDQLIRRHDLLINRLLGWDPPIVLPDPLHVACLLQALPKVPYGPVKHIISSATPVHTLRTTRTMLRDVAQSSAKQIMTTLGHRRPASVLTAQVVPVPQATEPPTNTDVIALLTRVLSQAKTGNKQQATGNKQQSTGSELFRIHGPCKHHGPKSMHATLECRDPTLSKRKRDKNTNKSTAETHFADVLNVTVDPSLIEPTSMFEVPAMSPTKVDFGGIAHEIIRLGHTVADPVSAIGKTNELPWREPAPIGTQVVPVPNVNHPTQGAFDRHSSLPIQENTGFSGAPALPGPLQRMRRTHRSDMHVHHTACSDTHSHHTACFPPSEVSKNAVRMEIPVATRGCNSIFVYDLLPQDMPHPGGPPPPCGQTESSPEHEPTSAAAIQHAGNDSAQQQDDDNNGDSPMNDPPSGDDNDAEAPPPGHPNGRRLTIHVRHALHYDCRLIIDTTLVWMRERLPFHHIATMLTQATGVQEVVLVANDHIIDGLHALRELDHQQAPIDYDFEVEHEIWFFIPDGYPNPPFGSAAAADPDSDDDYRFEIPIDPGASIIAPARPEDAAPSGQNCQNSTSAPKNAAPTDSDATKIDSAICISTAHAFIASDSKNKVVLDSGASRHVEPRQSAFSARTECSPVRLRGILGPAGVLNHVGTVGAFNHVLHAPQATTSIRSVGALLDNRPAHAVVFTAMDARLVPAPTTDNAKVIATRGEDGLYHIIPGTVPEAFKTATANFTVAGQVRREQIHQLHRILGHASPHVMRQVLQNNPRAPSGLRPSDVRLFSSCDACHRGKAKRQPRPSLTTTRATSFGYRIHTDTTGRINPPTKSGYQHANISVDDATRFAIATPLRGMTMEETTLAIKSIFRKIAAHESTLPTKILRSDNGTEFINSSVAQLLAAANITHERTCPGTSSQNGVAERTIGVLFAATRTLLIDAALPPSFWCEALMTATFVHNRLPMSANPNNSSPFEMRFGRVPDLRRLRPFGTTAYVRVREHLTKIQPRALRGLFLGYGDNVSGQKGWRVYVPDKHRVFTSADVTFTLDLRQAVHSRPAHLISATLPEMAPNDVSTRTGPRPPATIPANPDQSRQSQVPAQLAVRTATTQASARMRLPREAAANTAPRLALQQRHLATDLVPQQPRAARAHREPFDPHAMPTSAWRARPWSERHSSVPQTGGNTTTAAVATTSVAPPTHVITSQHPEFVALAVTASAAPDLASQYETPPTFTAATTGPNAARWTSSIKRELDSLKTHSVFQIIPRSSMPSGAKPIKCKWVFRVKQTSDGQVDKFKSRLTACGYAQRYGRDFTETFAPVASTASIRLVFILAALHNLQLHQFDISTAFLYGILPENERVYLNVPEGMTTPPDSVCLCLRGLYGLRQSPRLFNEHLDASLRYIGFSKSILDPCVYYYRNTDTNTLSYAAIVVDDILLCTNDPTHAQRFQDMLKTTYKLTTMGQPEWMIGLKVQKRGRTITLNQERYIMDIATKFGQIDCKPVSTPADSQTHLHTLTGDPLDSAKYNFLSLIGSLMWATLTRPDISAAVSRVAQFTAAPIWAHWKAGIRILRYLIHSRTLGLVYNGHSIQSTQVYAYADSAWGNERKGRSRYGFITLLGSCPISWCSKVTSMTCLSTAEAEYVAATEAAKELTWLRNLLTELGLEQPNPSIIHEDNQACIKMATNPVISARNRHFGIKMHWIRDQVATGIVSLVYVPTEKQLADIFTKILNKALFVLNRDQLVKDTTLDG